jgi:hypothetical protein
MTDTVQHMGGGLARAQGGCSDCERYGYKPFECVSCHGMFGGCMGNGDEIDYEHGPLCDDCAVAHPAWKASALEEKLDDVPGFRKGRRALRRSLQNTAGELHDDGIDIEWGGACPVQGEGTADGRPVYFRARSDDVRLDFFAAGADPHDHTVRESWSYEEDYDGAEPHAGWIFRDETAAFMRRAVAAWRAAGRP